jgi:YVTN family beta-propeller protein
MCKTSQLSNFRLKLVLTVALIAAIFLVGRSFLNLGVRAQSNGPSFLEFESGLVRPLAMSPDGTKLFATNTPNGTLEIFNITPSGLTPLARVPVGLEPVAVAAPNNNQVWVVNTLSDSVSVVTLTGTPHVTQTLLVGDEPRDIVFAGSPQRAFITTAHRGQQRTDPSIANVPGAGDPQLTTPSVPRADVWVFDPANLGTTFGGTPLTIMSFFTDTPRALTVSPDGNTVYVAGFKTGNQTTVVNEGRICPNFNTSQACTLDNGDAGVGGHLGPGADSRGETAPYVSMIVKYNNSDGHWEDELGRVWDSSVNFSLPDTDVFALDANQLVQTASFAHVGTTLFNMATNPVNGHVYVSNSDAQNTTRFEGPGTFSGHTVQGHLAEMRITVLNGSSVTPIHLNKHINYSILASNPAFDPSTASHSLSTPTFMQVTPDGKTLYVAAFGSNKIGVFNTTELENNTFNPVTESSNYIPVSGGGPAGLVLNAAKNQLYVLTRFDDAIKVVNLATNREVQAVSLPNPEPASVVQGRPFLYSASFSANGEAACASCHITGDKDDLAWDLGVPENPATSNPIPINLASEAQLGLALFGTPGQLNGVGNLSVFNSMKGPMTTQTLRGLANSGAMHWRGDRSNGQTGISATNEVTNFNNFIVAFTSLLGAAQEPTLAQMQQFTNFQLQVVEPPNPVRALDNSLNASQQLGQNFFNGSRPSDGINLGILGGIFNPIVGQTSFTCNGCHVLNPAAGQFGTGTNASFEGLQQIFKVPHLRNMYDKVGMFGFPRTSFFNNVATTNLGPQVRGTGFTNEGSVDSVFHFLNAKVFNPTLNSGFPLVNPDSTRRDVEQYVLAFDSDLAPIVGQQVTLTPSNAAVGGARLTLLEQRAGTAFTSKVLGGTVTECDLVATAVLNGAPMRFLYVPASNTFVSGNGALTLPDSTMRAIAALPGAGHEITFTAVTPGAGLRIAQSS